MKKLNSIAVLFVLAIVLLLTGCNKSTQENANNKYKLPLGDSGYISEIDFSLYNYREIKNSEDVIKGIVDYNYVKNNKKYTITLDSRTMDSKFNNKAVKLVVGYYTESGIFNAVTEPATFKLSGEGYTENKYEFTYPGDAETNKEKMVLKFCFGSNVDEEVYKSENPEAKKSNINKYLKNYRNVELKIKTLSITDEADDTNSILVEEAKLDEAVVQTTAKENDDLVYFNTATVNYENEVLTLKLNGKYGWWQWIIAELGKALYALTNLVGGWYWLGLTIFTLAVRTLGWPIYAKSNSATSNMSKIQPEMEKINKKYEGKTDQNSKMKQQMEIRKLMKDNHVSLFGCLLPFIQFPIFIAVYQVVQRFPLTPVYADVNYKFLWTTFKMTYGEAQGDWILAIIVGLTMVGSQFLTMYIQKMQQKKKANFYTAKNNQNNKTMLMFMAFTTVMMVVFAWKSAGIAYYWIIGNTYQMGQTAISKLIEQHKEDKELIASKRVRGR